MTKTELDNLIVESKRLDSAADSGPWATLIQGNGESQYCDIVQAEDTCAIVCVMSNSYRELDNAEFIAHSRTALPALVAEVERLRRCLDQAVDISELCLHYSAGASTPDGIDGYFDGWDPQPDGRPDLYAELKAREEG